MEGPSIIIIKEELAEFIGRKVLRVSGNAKIEKEKLCGQKIVSVDSWGKRLVMRCSKDTLTVHFLMFGSYRINEKKDAAPRLSLQFKTGEINFYSCSIGFLEGAWSDDYIREVDPMSPQWNPRRALRSLELNRESFLCDVLLDQKIFSGVGNIIKNEVLHRLRLHPLTKVKSLSTVKKLALIKETKKYCFQFLEWKRIFMLKKHWRVYRKRHCADCNAKSVMLKTGIRDRVSFICPNCQRLVPCGRAGNKTSAAPGTDRQRLPVH